MRYCPECGYKIIESSNRFCPECGNTLDKADSVDENINVKKYDTKNHDLLIDYYEKGVDTAYYEIVLYSYNDEKLIFEEYTNGGSESERCIQKLVPFEAYEKALKIVEDFHLKELLNRKGPGLDGMLYVIKFRESLTADNMYRFSSDNVGNKDTTIMFYEMKNILSSYKYLNDD